MFLSHFLLRSNETRAGRNFNSILLGGGLLLVAGCSQDKVEPSFPPMPAPATESQLGDLVQADPKLVYQFSQEHAVKVRVLNEQEHLFEIYGSSSTAIKEEIPSAKVAQNVWFRLQRENDSILKKANLGEFKTLLDGCKKEPKRPYARVTKVDGKPADLAPFVLGEEIALSGATSFSSEPQSNGESGLSMAWEVIPPEGSKVSLEHPVNGPIFQFKPDFLGSYQVLLLVRDSENRCGLRMVEILVTKNVPFKGRIEPRKLAAEEIPGFFQLHLTKADEALNLSPAQAKGQIVAILDSGVHYNHPDLADNILVHSQEIPENGLDDDGNGYVDDLVGWDFVNNDAFPYDDNSHGTHVAGIAASPVFGIAPNAKILPVKVLSAAGSGDMGSFMAGLLYALERGATVINISLGFSSPLINSDVIAKLMEEFKPIFEKIDQKGALLVAAAGNGDENGTPVDIDQVPCLPASFPIKNILTVAALDESQQLTSYSNFGEKTVHVAAPGGSMTQPMKSAFFENPENVELTEMMGTSMAAPVVSGIVLLARETGIGLSAQEIKEIMLTSGEKSLVLENKILSGKPLDALMVIERALTGAKKRSSTGPN